MIQTESDAEFDELGRRIEALPWLLDLARFLDQQRLRLGARDR